jgi:hypothetical protein
LGVAAMRQDRNWGEKGEKKKTILQAAAYYRSDIKKLYCILVVGMGFELGVGCPWLAFDTFIGFLMSYSLLVRSRVQIGY